MTQQELNTLTNGLQQNNETLAKNSATEKEQQLEQQKIQLQQQQLHQQATNQKIVIGGLVIAGVLVLVIVVYITHKIRYENRKKHNHSK